MQEGAQKGSEDGSEDGSQPTEEEPQPLAAEQMVDQPRPSLLQRHILDKHNKAEGYSLRRAIPQQPLEAGQLYSNSIQKQGQLKRRANSIQKHLAGPQEAESSSALARPPKPAVNSAQDCRRSEDPLVFSADASLTDEDCVLASAKKVKNDDLLICKFTGGGKYWARVETVVTSPTSIVAGCSFCDGTGATTISLWVRDGKPDFYELPEKAPPHLVACSKVSAFFAQAEAANLLAGGPANLVVLAEKMTWPVRECFDDYKCPFAPFHFLLGRDAFRPPTGDSLAASEKWIDGIPFENAVFAGAVNSSIPRSGDLLTIHQKLSASEVSSRSEIGYVVLAVITSFDAAMLDLTVRGLPQLDDCMDLESYSLLVQRFAAKGKGAASKEVQLLDHRGHNLNPGELHVEVLQYGLRSEEWHLMSVRDSRELSSLLGEPMLQRLSQGMRDHPVFSALFSDQMHEMERALSGAIFDWLRDAELFAQRCGGREEMIKQIVGSGLASASAVLAKPLRASLKPTAKQVEAALTSYTELFNLFTASLIALPQLYRSDPEARRTKSQGAVLPCDLPCPKTYDLHLPSRSHTYRRLSGKLARQVG